MRKLASIRKIRNIEPIEGADRIEVATVDGWKIVVNKGLHEIGDLIIYCEIDSFLPIREEFEFLRKTSFKKMADGSEGFRLKTIRMRGTYSQGLVLQYSVLPKGDFKVGEDVTEILKIRKYEAPIPPSLEGEVKGMFPSFIRKTDEERIQNYAEEYDEFRKHSFFVSEKLDGTSCTMYYNAKLAEDIDDLFGVCSRNLNLKETEKSTQWKLARKLDIETNMKKLGRNLAIQGEIIGEGIQKNLYKILGQQFRVFNIFDIDNHRYLPKDEMLQIIKSFGLETVPTVYKNIDLPETIEDILKMAEGNSLLNRKLSREGLVWVSNNTEQRISFKTISNKFLLKH